MTKLGIAGPLYVGPWTVVVVVATSVEAGAAGPLATWRGSREPHAIVVAGAGNLLCVDLAGQPLPVGPLLASLPQLAALLSLR